MIRSGRRLETILFRSLSIWPRISPISPWHCSESGQSVSCHILDDARTNNYFASFIFLSEHNFIAFLAMSGNEFVVLFLSGNGEIAIFYDYFATLATSVSSGESNDGLLSLRTNPSKCTRQ